MNSVRNAAFNRAFAALAIAAQPERDTRNDDAHIAAVVRSLVHGDSLPSAAEQEYRELQRQGHQCQRGSIMVPLHRFFSRDLISGTATGTSKGGNTIGVDVGPFVPELGVSPAVIAAGATVLPGLVGDTKIPTLSTAAAAYWLTDDVSGPTEAAPVFGSTTLTPKTVSAYVDIAHRMRVQAALPVEGLMRQHLARQIARALDAAALVGSGSAGQPTGIKNISGVGSVAIGTNGGAPTWATAQSCFSSLADANAITPESRLAFLANSKTMAKAAKTTRQSSGVEGAFLYTPDDGMNGRLGGWPCHLANNLPNDGTKGSGTNLSTLIFGDWSQLLIGLFGGVELLANPYTAGSTTGMTRLHAFLSVDVAVPQPAAFVFVSDIVTT